MVFAAETTENDGNPHPALKGPLGLIGNAEEASR
jgi:hypothetical protein